MIITDLLEYVGKNVRVYFEDGDIKQGKLEYVPSYSEMYDFRRPKHFYICDKDGEWCFRAWHIKKVEEL